MYKPEAKGRGHVLKYYDGHGYSVAPAQGNYKLIRKL